MKIKEIIDIEKYRNKDGYVENISLMPDEIHKLSDYITNLQQINKNLTNSLNKKVEEGIKLQLENDKLKEQCKQWKENHKAVCIQRDNILNNTVKDIEEQIDYKSRNEKAIDKLNTQLAFTSSYQLNYQSAMNIIEETKSILQGSDKE